MLNLLIAYNHDANFRVIDTFNKAGKEIPQAERLFSHILNAQQIWLNRINGVITPLDRFEPQAVNDFTLLQNKCTEGLKAVLEKKDLNSEITYRTSFGQEYTNSIADILYHIINHSTYHRGQIASIFRANSVEPPVTDYIAMRREIA